LQADRDKIREYEREKKSQKLDKIKLEDVEGYKDVVVRFDWEK